MSDHDRRKWNQRYRQRSLANPDDPVDNEPSSFLRALDTMLPRHGRALDVAGGAGRHAIWLARRGYEVTLLDISDVALTHARARAAAAGVALRTIALDLDRVSRGGEDSDDDTVRFPPGPWDLIVDIHFLDRALFPIFARELAPGGYLVFMQQTMTNLSRHARPGAQFLLDDGELPALIAGIGELDELDNIDKPVLDILTYHEGWLENGRHGAQLVARRR